MPLSDYTRADKNEIVSQNLFLVCLDIEIPVSISGEVVTTQHIYFVKDNQDLIWRTDLHNNPITWYGIEFSLDAVTESHQNEIPQVKLSISNTNRMIEHYLQLYDTFTKLYGYYAITVEILVVNTGNVDAYNVLRPESEISYTFELKQPDTNDKVATFTLGAPNAYTRRMPLHRMLRNQGRVRKFSDWECGYKIIDLIKHPSNLTYTTTSLVSTGDKFVNIAPSNLTVLPVNTVFNVSGQATQYHVADRNSYNNQSAYYAVLTQKDFAVFPGATSLNVAKINHVLLKANSTFTVRLADRIVNNYDDTTVRPEVAQGSTYAKIGYNPTAEIPGVRATGTVKVLTRIYEDFYMEIAAPTEGNTLTVGNKVFTFTRSRPINIGGDGTFGDNTGSSTAGPGPSSGDGIGGDIA